MIVAFFALYNFVNKYAFFIFVSNPQILLQPQLFETEQVGIKPDTLRMYEDIRKAYHKLMGVKKRGVRLYNESYVLAEVAYMFYKSPKTIENIVYNRVKMVS